MDSKQQFNSNYAALNQLAEEALSENWITQQLVDDLSKVEQQQADDLFSQPVSDSIKRPLIVAFFGGTGTGKSSLLNRLAGKNIAKTGVVRPTSLEVTLYLHKSIELANLPDELPLDLINISTHDDDDKKAIAWLDMPDFDSTETANHELVNLWLPYIDWLVYVVSPERYQDDSGWQILQQRSHRHRWLFVMNHWDEGSDIQFDDFKNKLLGNGIKDPVVLRTSCVEPRPQKEIDDDFSQLENTIHQAIKTYGLELLQSSGLRARINDLLDFASAFKNVIGNQQQWQQGKTILAETGEQRIEAVAKTLQGSINAITMPIIDQESQSLWFFKRQQSSSLGEPVTMVKNSISHHSLAMLDDLSTELPLATKLNAVDALSTSFKGFGEEGHSVLTASLESNLIEALATPGTAIQRFFVKLTGLLAWLLPLLTAIWVAFHLFSAYLQGTTESGEFLGLDFAIHSGLLIGASWLIPFIIHRKLQPSLAKTTRKGLLNGVDAAKSMLTDSIERRFNQAQLRYQSINQRLDGIIAQLDT